MKRLILGVALIASIAAQAEDVSLYGVLRIQDGKWGAINDVGHKPKGIKRVEANNQYIRVYYTFDASFVGVFHVSSDETYAIAGIQCGASVTRKYATIYCSDRKGKISPLNMEKTYANLWVSGIFDL